jgi:hypothetical protein
MTARDLRFSQASDRIIQIDGANPLLRGKIHAGLLKLRQNLNGHWNSASDSQQRERQLIDSALRNFVMKETRPWEFFQARGWTDLSVPYLVSMAEVFSLKTSIPLDRDSRRRKPLLFHWLEEHWDTCLPYAMELEPDPPVE